LIVGAFVALICAAASSPQSIENFEHWAATHALPLRTVEPWGSVDDLHQLAPVIAAARVVALGEPAHGAHEPLAFRNRLFQYLVEEQGFTAIAIESGLPESRRIQDFVAGEAGDAAQIVRDNLSYGFGAFGENVDLVQWMRAFNTDSAHRRHVRFYGVDLSLGGPHGYTPKPFAFQAVLAYLARVDPASARDQETVLHPFMVRLPEVASFSASEHNRFATAIDDFVSLLERNRRRFIAASSNVEYEWAHQTAVVARQGERQFRIAPQDVAVGGIAPSGWQAAEARDQAMSENVRWILAEEGPAGRILVFAHNAHVMNARLEGGIWSALTRAPHAMGVHLRSALHNTVVLIGTSSAANVPGRPWVPDEGNVDSALARVGLPQFLLDLRRSHAAPAATAWLTERHTLRANFTTSLLVSPNRAFDVIVFIETMTPARTNSRTREDSAAIDISARQR
jgi:erythromycin esterase